VSGWFGRYQGRPKPGPGPGGRAMTGKTLTQPTPPTTTDAPHRRQLQSQCSEAFPPATGHWMVTTRPNRISPATGTLPSMAFVGLVTRSGNGSADCRAGQGSFELGCHVARAGGAVLYLFTALIRSNLASDHMPIAHCPARWRSVLLLN